MYNEVLLDHNMHPQHKNGTIVGAKKHELMNASCGDKYTLFIKMNGDKIVAASFEGNGCAVSQASIDMMIDLIVGKTIREATELYYSFSGLIRYGLTEEALGDANALQDVSKMPARVKCAELAWTWFNH